MPSLNKDLLDSTTRTVMNRASDLMRTYGKPILMPEMAMLAMLRMPESTAYRAIAKLAESRSLSQPTWRRKPRRRRARARVAPPSSTTSPTRTRPLR